MELPSILSGPRRPGHGHFDSPLGRIRFRPAVAADGPAIEALFLQILEEGQGFVRLLEEHKPGDTALRIEVLARGPGICILAEGPPGILGAILLQTSVYRRLSHRLTLEIFVQAQARGLGLGSALLDTALAWVRTHPEFSKVSLAVFADNAGAIRLYQSKGFVEEGRRVAEYREPGGRYRDDLVMALDLRA